MSNRNMSLGQITIAQPNWAGDYLDRDALLPGGGRVDASTIIAYPGPVVVTLTADAAVNATALVVTALSAAIPPGTVLNFGVNGRFAVVASLVAAAATSVPVLPIDQAILTGASATFAGSAKKELPSGTLVSRTFAQRAAGAAFHPAVSTEDEFFLTAHDISDAAVNDEVALVRPHSITVKENFLPGWTGLSTALKAVVRAQFLTTVGAE